MDVEIVKIIPSQKGALEDIASVYQKTFGSDPWNEGYRCPVCEKVFPLSCKEKECPSCAKAILEEYWPIEKIISDFLTEMAKPKSLCLAALANGKIIGFAWGYEIIVDPSIDLRLEAPGLHQLASGVYFYLDEAAILPPFQNKGIGKKLIQRIFMEQNQSNILLRTLNGSRMFQIIQKMDGKPALLISRDRVIMTLDLSLY
ncbi:MAG: GNAT family N-acetyltransferase [Candidatus Pacebacteria bacterium]|jgi:GNAT superfamily N-acetyltransferase|nr:GNAT family N-acetyltransferase [Candidatus Paceibacterota bacterium]